jgi:sugar/nucleoside kinase (ribokinase family)
MSLLVTGSIGIDTVKTPYGVSENCLGGSAVYFSMAASFFAPVRFMGVVGADCPFDLKSVFAGRDVDFSGLEVRHHSRTFRWKGSYHDSMGEAITDNVELNVLSEDPPKLPAIYRDSKFVFLANTAPSLQSELLGQVENSLFSAADTMNCWIDGRLEDLKVLLKKVNALIINDQEARQLSKERNLVTAAEKILVMGPAILIIKKGESGSMMFSKSGEKFMLPAYPADRVIDPTGAGDSFAGAFMGYIAKSGRMDFESLKTAIAYGTVAASFAIEDFSVLRLAAIKRADIEGRLGTLRSYTKF